MSKHLKMKSTERKKKAMVHVLGCKVNQAEAAAMARILEDKGYVVDPETADPDLVVVNTCCVTSRAEGKSRRAVNRLAHKFPEASLMITGCLAEVNPASLEGAAKYQIVLGTREKDQFHELIDAARGGFNQPPARTSSQGRLFGDLGAARISGRSRAFLKVQDGCSQGCAYCIVPRARGPSRSLPLDRAIESAKELQDTGTSEIVLTGIHLGAYGQDLDAELRPADLLERLVEACPLVRFRLSSMEPQEISPRLIELVSRHPAICRHFHIPLQSGDNAILARMGRPYDTALIEDLVERVFRHSSGICVGMDVMAGFPGEDERSFRKTRRLIEQVRPAYLHVFPFSPRPGTRAASFQPRVPDQSARERVEELRALSTALRKEFFERFLGKVLTVVPEEQPSSAQQIITARSDNYIPVKVVVPPEAANKRAFAVKLEAVVNGEVRGTVSSEA